MGKQSRQASLVEAVDNLLRLGGETKAALELVRAVVTDQEYRGLLLLYGQTVGVKRTWHRGKANA